MIKNEYLRMLYDYNDKNLALNQLLENIQAEDNRFVNSMINEEPSLDDCTKDEINFLIWITGIMQYFIQDSKLDKPQWLNDSRLSFNGSVYLLKREDPFLSEAGRG